jgi:thioredoxin 1
MNREEFNAEVSDGIVIVDFWAEWCGPCKMVTPVLEELASEFDAKLFKVNVDDNPELAKEFGITGIPAIMLYKDGNKMREVTGAKPKPALKKALFN